MIRTNIFTRIAFYNSFMIVLGMASISFLGSGCGANDVERSGEFSQIDRGDRTYSIDDFKTIGYKTSKQYDVSELTGAQDAWFGFWKADGKTPVEYELRFYVSHEEAISYGQALAEEVTGEDALIDESASWKEGLRDRRAAGGAQTTWGTVYPRYGDFAIYANIVMLCEGLDSAQSLERCSSMVDVLATLVPVHQTNP